LDNIQKNKTGYLNNDYELFHIKDKRNMEFMFHYHDFNKLIIFISGDVTYIIEGKNYKLKPWDILIVGSNQVHRPIINPEQTYERIVIWINTSFLKKHSTSTDDLSLCFAKACTGDKNILRIRPDMLPFLKSIITQLEDAGKSRLFGSKVLGNALLIELLVHINRIFLYETHFEPVEAEFDPQIKNLLEYINKNLDKNLSIENIASYFYTSKYHLMHKFKKHTGFSLHSYITQKRLSLACSLLSQNQNASAVYTKCGFGDYSSFVRAFKKYYSISPREYAKNIKEASKLNASHNHFFTS